MSKTKKKSPIKKLIIFAVIVVIIAILAFVPAIIQSILTNNDIATLFDKFGFSYEVMNYSNICLVSCNSCGYANIVENERNDKFACPICSTDIKKVICDKYNIEYLYSFSKVSSVEDESEENIQLEAGEVYVFDAKDIEKALPILKKYVNNDNRIFETKENSVFVLYSQPSDALSNILNRLEKVK